MVETYKPETEDQVRDLVAWAAAEETPLELLGRGTKRGLGRPVETDHVLDLSGLSGIVLYEPAELVMSARLGTPLAEIDAALAENGQALAFEPPDLGPLLGGASGAAGGAASIGGVFACNLAGPRRIKAGGARDHLLGLRAVTGRGEAIKAGGRVVKNVTGYDLCKLFAGAHGTLAAMTELTFKVLPAAEDAATVAIRGLDDDAAIRAMTAAAASPHEVSGVAHLPGPAAARAGLADGRAATLIRVEGPGPSVAHRAEALAAMGAEHGPVETLGRPETRALWRAIGDVVPLDASDGRIVWRLSVPPAAGARAVAAIVGGIEGADWFHDWSGGLIWLSLDAGPDDGNGGAARLRAIVTGLGGHATLVRAEADLRARVPVFQPQPAPLAALTARIKDGFDPRHVLNPGRMYAGL